MSRSRVLVMMSLVVLRSCGNCALSSAAVAFTRSPTTSNTSSAFPLLRAESALGKNSKHNVRYSAHKHMLLENK